MAGKDWFKGFCRRNPEVSLRKAESTSISRVIGFRKSEVTRFYDNLATVFQQHNFEPQRVYNVDETGLSTVQKLREKIVAAKGEKQVGKIVSGEKGETVTAVCCVSATGTYVPPMLIFCRKKFTDQLMRNAPTGSIGSCSPSGWINAELFILWLKHFIKHTSASTDRKVLLILDNHESHISYESFSLCRDNGVIVVSLPPHSSHRCQPLDLTIYGPMKMAYSKRCSEWLMSHPGKRITQYEIAELFGDAYNKTSTVDKAVSGFRSSGIYPLNSNIFNDEDFAAADNLLSHPINPTTDNGHTSTPDLEMEVTEVEPSVESVVADAADMPTADSINRDDVADLENGPTDGPTVNDRDEPFDKQQDDLAENLLVGLADEMAIAEKRNPVGLSNSNKLDQQQNLIVVGSDCEKQQMVLTEAPPKTCCEPASRPNRVSVLEISPIPKPIPKENTRKARCKRSEIITSSPMKEILKVKHEKQQKKAAKGVANPTRNKAVKYLPKENLKEKQCTKKATCRKDKRAARKLPLPPRPKKPRLSADVTRSLQSDYYCLICSEPYTEPPTETWIQCKSCGGWCHEDCTGGCTSKGYICDFCQ